MTSDITLDQAKAAVQFALQQAVEEGLPEAEAAVLAREIQACTGVFELDEWVFGQPLLRKRFCRYPLCFNPPRPGKRKGGNPPAYCADGIDEEGQRHDGPFSSQRSIRRRMTLRAQAGKPSADTASTELVVRGSHVVTRARSDMAGKIMGIERGLDGLAREVAELRSVAEQAVDEEARWAEIEAIRSESERAVQEERGLRLAAENTARADRSALSQMAEDLSEMQAAMEEAIEEAQTARTDREEALRQVAEAASTAKRITAETNEKLRQAAEATAQAQAAAKQTEVQAEARVKAADKAAADARAAYEEANRQLTALRQENVGLRDKAIEREQHFEEIIEKLHGKYQAEQRQLHDVIDGLQTKIDTLRAEHEQVQQHLRKSCKQEISGRVQEIRESLTLLHKAEIAQLHAGHTAAMTKLQAAHDALQSQLEAAATDAQRSS